MNVQNNQIYHLVKKKKYEFLKYLVAIKSVQAIILWFYFSLSLFGLGF